MAVELFKIVENDNICKTARKEAKNLHKKGSLKGNSRNLIWF